MAFYIWIPVTYLSQKCPWLINISVSPTLLKSSLKSLNLFAYEGHNNTNNFLYFQEYLKIGCIQQHFFFNCTQNPQSVCSESYEPRFRKFTLERKSVYCYNCTPCTYNEISKETGKCRFYQKLPHFSTGFNNTLGNITGVNRSKRWMISSLCFRS